MNRAELAALRDAIDTVLTWPDAVRAEIARWLAPSAAKPNGRDPHPPLALMDRDVATNVATNVAIGARRSLTPYAGKAHRGKASTRAQPRQAAPTPSAAKVRQGAPFNMKAAEQRLLEALAERPGATVIVLANAASSSRSRTGERLRQLASRGLVTKDAGGHWRLVAELAGEAVGPQQPSPD